MRSSRQKVMGSFLYLNSYIFKKNSSFLLCRLGCLLSLHIHIVRQLFSEWYSFFFFDYFQHMRLHCFRLDERDIVTVKHQTCPFAFVHLVCGSPLAKIE